MEDKYIQFIKNKYEPIPCMGEGINLTMANYIPLRLGEESRMEILPIKGRTDIPVCPEDFRVWKEEHSPRRTVLTPVDVWSAINKNKRTVAKGDPGSGKTTLTHYIAYEPKGMIPLVIDLKDWAWKDCNSLPEYYPQSVLIKNSNIARKIKPEIIENWLDSGKCIILCDGLDEVPQNKRETLIQSLQALTSWNCHLVVTTRIAGYNNELSNWQHYEVMPLEKKHIERYAKDYLKDKSQSFLSALKNTPRMVPLSKNPLLLSVLCFVFDRDNLTLPTQRVELYSKAVNKMLELRNPEIPSSLKQNALKEIAIHFLYKGSKEAFEEDEIRGIIKAFLKRENESCNADVVLKEIAEKSGLLYRYGDGRYIFLHLTFQEYFAACYIAEKVKDPCKFFGQALFNPKFREVVRLTTGMLKNTDDTTRFINFIRNQKPPYYKVLHQPLLLAGLCIADVQDDPSFPPLVGQTFLSVLNELWRLWKRTKYSPLREEINRVFTASAWKGMADTMINNLLDARKDKDLLNALKDEDSEVSVSAADALGKLRRADENVIEALIGALKDGSSEVRNYAYSSLQRLAEGKAREGHVNLPVDEKGEIMDKRGKEGITITTGDSPIIQIGSDGATQSININKEGYKELDEGIRLLKEYISNDGRNRFGQQKTSELGKRISKIEEQINSENPDNKITKENSKRIFSILKEVLKGGGIHTGAIVSGHKLLEHWDRIKTLFW